MPPLLEDETAATAAGASGPGWARTGWSFSANRIGQASSVNSEVYGDREIGLNLADYPLELLRR